MTHLTAPRLAGLALAGIALAGCAPAAPVATVTATVGPESPSASPSNSPQSTTEVEPGDEGGIGTWYIDFTGVGPFSVDQTAAEVSAITGNPYDGMLDDFDGYCAGFPLADSGELSLISALAESDSAYGTIDTYSIGDWADTGIALPTTYENITVGSTYADLAAAYTEALSIEEYLYDSTWSRAWVEQDGYGMLFLIDDTDNIVSITAGRDPQYRYVEGCA